MQGARTHILVNQTQKLYLNSENPAADASAVLWDQPSNLVEWGAEAPKVTFQVRVAAVGGGPTSWSLGVKTQVLVPHTTGNGYQYPVWVDLDSYTLAGCVEEGVGWGSATHVPPTDGSYGTVADQTDTLPVTVFRTISNFGIGCRLKLNPAGAGGTNPHLNATILAIPHA